ncbi:MAG: hypothetical protein WCD31_11455 [Gillisia sp.]
MIKVNKNKNFVQMLTFFFGCLVFVTLAGYLVFQIATKKEGPPSLVVHTRYVPSMKHLAYEVTVRNVGEESAQSATVNLDLFQQGKLKASSTVTISYVPKKSKETTWVVFYEKKSSSDSVAVSSVTYVKP